LWLGLASTAATRPFPAVFGVLTGGLWAAHKMYNGVSPIRLF
jgi:hypothetical protein